MRGRTAGPCTAVRPARPGENHPFWHIIANEMNVNIRITSGPAIEKPGDLAALLTNLEPERYSCLSTRFTGCPGRWKRCFIPLWRILRWTSSSGKGLSARSIRIDLPHFTLVGATTRAGQLTCAAARPVWRDPAAGAVYAEELARNDHSAQRRNFGDCLRSRTVLLELAKRSPRDAAYCEPPA